MTFKKLKFASLPEQYLDNSQSMLSIVCKGTISLVESNVNSSDKILFISTVLRWEHKLITQKMANKTRTKYDLAEQTFKCNVQMYKTRRKPLPYF